MELAALAYNYSIPSYGLKTLCASILQREMSKEIHVRCSDWEVETLAPEQVQYAAADAYASREIFLKFHERFEADTPIRAWAEQYFDARPCSRKNKPGMANMSASKLSVTSDAEWVAHKRRKFAAKGNVYGKAHASCSVDWLLGRKLHHDVPRQCHSLPL